MSSKLLLFMFLLIAFSTKWHVHVCSSNHFMVVWWCCSEGVIRTVGTYLADSGEFHDFFTKGNKIVYVIPVSSLACAIEWRNYHYFATVCCVFCEFINIFKELSLIYSNHIKLAPIIFDVTHWSARYCFSQLFIMRANAILRISLVSLKFDTKTHFARNFQSLYPSKEFCALSSKHRSNYEFNFSSLTHIT